VASKAEIFIMHQNPLQGLGPNPDILICKFSGNRNASIHMKSTELAVMTDHSLPRLYAQIQAGLFSTTDQGNKILNYIDS
jgi:hypothetical protein